MGSQTKFTLWKSLKYVYSVNNVTREQKKIFISHQFKKQKLRDDVRSGSCRRHCTVSNEVKKISACARRYRVWYWCLQHRRRSVLWATPVCLQRLKRLILGDSKEKIQGIDIRRTWRPSNGSATSNPFYATSRWLHTCLEKMLGCIMHEPHVPLLQITIIFLLL